MAWAFPHQSNGLSGFAGAVGGIVLGLCCGLMMGMGLGVVHMHDGRLVFPEERHGRIAVVWRVVRVEPGWSLGGEFEPLERAGGCFPVCGWP